jgi:preprotein translocase subunit SecE
MKKILTPFKSFFDEVRVEMQRTAWPDWNTTMGSTIAVIIFSLLVALFVGLLDFLIARIMGVILK